MYEQQTMTPMRTVLALQELDCAARGGTALLSGMSVDCQS